MADEAQFIIATHSPIIMSYPNAMLLHMTNEGLSQIDYRMTDHFALMSEFFSDPEAFLDERLAKVT
ncbi:hypothetical protein QA646_29840 (plasmid) [Rhizobium sp. CB3090]|uniref:hypothetical protein n=1 Tax=Rhizobium sp. CB3090 TaxID=3039156 RepID=UPI0024B14046|nr:hypothetical protein [Rhizobium sp. CB3090]WFU13403.1 hypothetical protein QA646_29840 [Rhizobium sp. CB3090]